MLMPDTQCMVYLYIYIKFTNIFHLPSQKISPTVATFITHPWSICKQTATSPLVIFQPSDLTGEQLETLPEGRCLREANGTGTDAFPQWVALGHKLMGLTTKEQL